MEACTTLGLKQSTVSALQINSSTPNQSQRRRMVPKFPGSPTPSTARVMGEGGTIGGSGISKTPKKGLGVLK